MSGPSGSTACETFVDALGLKSLFTTFMGNASKKNKGIDFTASEDTSHTLSIVSSLFSNLSSESPARVRLLAKFVENNYEKVDKVLEIRESAQRRLTGTDADIEQEKKVVTPCDPQPLLFLIILLGDDRRRREARGRRGSAVVSPTFGWRPFHIADGRLHSCVVVDRRRWSKSVCTQVLMFLNPTNSRFYRTSSKCSAVRTSHSKI
jgi:hypothetical protein